MWVLNSQPLDLGRGLVVKVLDSKFESCEFKTHTGHGSFSKLRQFRLPYFASVYSAANEYKLSTNCCQIPPPPLPPNEHVLTWNACVGHRHLLDSLRSTPPECLNVVGVSSPRSCDDVIIIIIITVIIIIIIINTINISVQYLQQT